MLNQLREKSIQYSYAFIHFQKYFESKSHWKLCIATQTKAIISLSTSIAYNLNSNELNDCPKSWKKLLSKTSCTVHYIVYITNFIRFLCFWSIFLIHLVLTKHTKAVKIILFMLSRHILVIIFIIIIIFFFCDWNEWKKQR